MKVPNFFPHALVIYWDSESIEFQSTISELRYLEYWNRFLETIGSIYPSGPIYTNVIVPHSSNIHSMNPSYHFESLVSYDEVGFFKLVHPKLPLKTIGNEDWDEVCFLYLNGVAPLMDRELCREFWSRHIKYFSQYSYSENLPEGIVPRILTREFLDSLPSSLTISSHDYFIKNINNYDVEIFFKNPDLRQYRISLLPNDNRTYHLINSIIDSLKIENPKWEWKYENLQKFIHNTPVSIRPSPSWIELEIYRGCELKCSFCPRQFIDNGNDGNYISIDTIRKLVEEKNQLPGKITYCLGGMGEPLLHPQLKAILIELLATNELKEIIIESALAVDRLIIDKEIISLFRELSESNRKKIQFIINLTTLNKPKYNTLYGENRFDLVVSNIKYLSEEISKSNVSVQILKILETEDEVEHYFDYFEKEGFPIIFQKYNRYIDAMPEKRVSDLTPLIRDFCWHLGRDLYVEANGSVKLCKQAVLIDSMIIGNINQENLREIWNKGLKFFSMSLNGNHSEIPIPCMNCDEWYTFNA